MSELRFQSAAVLGTGLVAGLFLTIRVTRVGTGNFMRYREAGAPVMFVVRHGELLPLIHYHRNEGIAVLVSEHEDGEYLARIMQRNGFEAVRGSSTKGGTRGLKGLVRAARAGRDIGVTPDGPTGPPGAFKSGALLAAKMTGLPVVPIAVRASSGWKFRSWDGFLVPKPFSEITLEYLEPRLVPRHASREDLDRIGSEIAAGLDERSQTPS